jgi:hypothetical protein
VSTTPLSSRHHPDHRSEEFLYELKAGPAGGRLRRPSSAGRMIRAWLIVSPRVGRYCKFPCMSSLNAWTTAAALYGAVVATASLIVAVLAYRAGGPSIKVSTWLRPATSDQPAEVVIGVANRGRGEATVNDIFLNVPGPHTITLRGPNDLQGPALPCRLPASSQLAWRVDAGWLLHEVRRNGWHHQVRAVVGLPGGQQVWESIHSYTNLVSG